MSLVDDLYFLAHDDATGRPLVSTGATAYGLAGAVLTELLIEQKIVVDAERQVAPTTKPTPPTGALAHLYFDAIRNQEQHDLRTWLTYLSQSVYDKAIDRLVTSGELREESGNGLLRRAVRFRPTDMMRATKPWITLLHHAKNRQTLDLYHLALGGLADMTGVLDTVLRTAEHSDIAHLRAQLPYLWHPVRDVIEEARSAIGAAVLSHRM
ncbi:GOLPH3/VPS74 family protein [Micromonospora maritima]|uniref:GOLPH3/VPS74 family protein n=1 Tax=Micromonospora maritima TaxID=986711 RepID=UPI00157C00B4|nr:GPP34 family phosphoprotein [Micromonospora maritima]